MPVKHMVMVTVMEKVTCKFYQTFYLMHDE